MNLVLPLTIRISRKCVTFGKHLLMQVSQVRSFASSPSEPPPNKYGSLVSDYTFSRVMGTPNQSEVILKDLLNSWLGAIVVARENKNEGKGTEVEEVMILNRTVRDSSRVAGFVQPKGMLTVDVHFRDATDNCIVEVQHRVEPRFPHRALLYACADICGQQSAPGEGGRAPPLTLRPVHSLAFCDYDFVRRKKDGAISSNLTKWRTSTSWERDESQAISVFNLLPNGSAMNKMRQTGNVALNEELLTMLSFTFAMLPHAPRLEDLTASTPSLIRWASLVAHVSPDNIDAVPKDVQRIEGVKKMLEILHDTKKKVKKEREQSERDESEMKVALDASFDEGAEEGMLKGRVKGRVEGMLELLRLNGVTSTSEYIAKFGKAPAAEIAAAFQKA